MNIGKHEASYLKRTSTSSSSTCGFCREDDPEPGIEMARVERSGSVANTSSDLNAIR